MSFKNPKNLIVVVSVVVALLAGTVLLGGYANSKPAGDGCSMKGGSATCSKMAGAEQNASGCCGTPCTEDCPKPCCVKEAPKGCCGTSESTGCCSAKAADQ